MKSKRAEKSLALAALLLGTCVAIGTAEGDATRRRISARPPAQSRPIIADAAASSDANDDAAADSGAGMCYVMDGETAGSVSVTLYAVGCGNFPGISGGNPYSLSLEQDPGAPSQVEVVSCTACTVATAFTVNLTCTAVTYDWNYSSLACVIGSNADSGVNPDANADAAANPDADSGDFPAPINNTYYDDCTLWVHAHSTTHAQVDELAKGLSHPANDGDKVGTVDSPCPGAHSVQAQSSARSPVYGHSGDASVIDFSGDGGQTKRYVVDNSQRSFQSWFDENRLGTLMMQVRMTQADGTAVQFLDSNAGSTANAGIYLARTTGNKIQWISSKASSGSTVCGGTTSASFTQASGLDWIIVRENGTQVVIRVGLAGTDETFACANAGVGADAGVFATNALNIAGLASGSGTTSFMMANMIMYRTSLSNSDVTAIANSAGTLTRGTNRMLKHLTAADGCYNFLNIWYKFTDNNYVFEDTAATDTAEAGDQVRVVRDPRDRYNNWLRGATSTVAGGPTYQGSSGLSWPGTGSQTLLLSNGWHQMGSNTVIVKGENLDTTLGSHILHGGNYWVQTGANYASNIDAGTADASGSYHLTHATGGSATNYTFCSGSTGTWWENSRDGAAWLTGCNGEANGVTSSTNNTSWQPTSIGRENNAGWKMYGYQEQIFRFMTQLTKEEKAWLEAGCP